jgi:hypothetical protein
MYNVVCKNDVMQSPSCVYFQITRDQRGPWPPGSVYSRVLLIVASTTKQQHVAEGNLHQVHACKTKKIDDINHI